MQSCYWRINNIWHWVKTGGTLVNHRSNATQISPQEMQVTAVWTLLTHCHMFLHQAKSTFELNPPTRSLPSGRSRTGSTAAFSPFTQGGITRFFSSFTRKPEARDNSSDTAPTHPHCVVRGGSGRALFQVSMW